MPKNKFECVRCGSQFEKYKEEAKYCGRECWKKSITGEGHPNWTGHGPGTKTECDYCGTEFERNRSKQKYCSQNCQMNYEYENGERDPNKTVKDAQEAKRNQGLEKFKENPTTRVSKRGYRLIYIPAAFAEKQDELEDGWMKMHHYVWWKEKGELPPVDNINDKGNGKVMHHKDGNKLNNNIENLEIMKNKEHRKLHANN